MSMIRKSGNRFSLATNAERVCAEIMLKTKSSSMRNLIAAGLIAGATPACAASEAAEAAEKEAGALRNQWTTTEATLTAAKKAAEAGQFDQAVASSKEAEALAKASIFQATSEKQRWKDLEIR